jgi:DNA-binding transcriptional ArsR family regulator
MKETEKILKALANRRRLMILIYLHKVNKASVGEIAREIKLSFKATSKHLRILANANLLEREQISLTMLYFLAVPINPILKSTLNVL